MYPVVVAVWGVSISLWGPSAGRILQHCNSATLGRAPAYVREGSMPVTYQDRSRAPALPVPLPRAGGVGAGAGIPPPLDEGAQTVADLHAL